MSFIISADEIKKELTNYSPDKAEEFHRESAMKADKIFSKALKERSYIGVILLNGGTASGKSEFLSTQLKGKNYIILGVSLKLSSKSKLLKVRVILDAFAGLINQNNRSSSS